MKNSITQITEKFIKNIGEIFKECNLGRVTAKLTDTAFHCIAMSIVVLNLRKLMLSLAQFLKQHLLYIGFFEFSFVQ